MMNISEFNGRLFVIKRVIEGEVRRMLTYDSSLCFGCELCSTACPQNAIKLYPLAYMLTGRPRIRIDAKSCLLCGVCSEVCPSGAIKVDGARIRLRRLFFADFECEACRMCEEACPWDAIVSVGKEGEEETERNEGEEDNEGEKRGKASKRWIEELCIFCGKCAKVCPEGRIFVEKPISGEISIGEDCKLCGVCMDICPAHAISFDGKKMVVDTDVCIFCGACRNACPIKVIEVRRKEIRIENADYPWFSQHERALKCVLK